MLPASGPCPHLSSVPQPRRTYSFPPDSPNSPSQAVDYWIPPPSAADAAPTPTAGGGPEVRARRRRIRIALDADRKVICEHEPPLLSAARGSPPSPSPIFFRPARAQSRDCAAAAGRPTP